MKNNNLINYILPIITALLSSYFAYLKLEKEFILNHKKKIINYLFKTYIEDGFIVLNIYLKKIYNIIINYNYETKITDKEITPPFYLIKLMDYRYHTKWYDLFHTIYISLKESSLASGEELNTEEILFILEILVEEIAYFKRKQELNITASSFRIYIWHIFAKIKYHKKITSRLTRNLPHGA